jgi:hypothetical protein
MNELERRYKTVTQKSSVKRTWWYMPVISALRRLKEEDNEYEASLYYKVRACL